MRSQEALQITGRLTIRQWDIAGRMVGETVANNSIVRSGRDLVAKMFIKQTINPVSHFAVGTGTTPDRPRASASRPRGRPDSRGTAPTGTTMRLAPATTQRTRWKPDGSSSPSTMRPSRRGRAPGRGRAVGGGRIGVAGDDGSVRKRVGDQSIIGKHGNLKCVATSRPETSTAARRGP